MKNINLGKYDLNKLLRNPATIHLIQDKLRELPGNDLLSEAYRQGANNPDKVIKQIISDYEDNSRLVIETVGFDILKLIEEYEDITLAADIPKTLFTIHNRKGDIGEIGCDAHFEQP